MRGRFAYVFPCIALCLSVPPAAQAAVLGEVISVRNGATLERGSATLPLASGDSVSTGETIATEPTSSVTLRLSDKTDITVGASSSVAFGDAAGSPIDLDKGALRIAEGSPPTASITIRTAVGTINLRGGDAAIICDGVKKCAVVVTTGKVVVCPNSDAACSNGYTLDKTNNFTLLDRDGNNFGPQRVSASIVRSTNDAVAGGRVIDIAGLGETPGAAGGAPARFAFNGPPGVPAPPVFLGATIGLEYSLVLGKVLRGPAQPVSP